MKSNIFSRIEHFKHVLWLANESCASIKRFIEWLHSATLTKICFMQILIILVLHACNTKIIRVCMKQIFVSVATWSHSRWNFLGACNAAMLHCIRIKMLHGPNGWSFFESILNNSEFLTACATFLKSHCYVNKTTILIALNGFLFSLTKFLF